MDSGMEGENVRRHKNLESNGKGRRVNKIQILQFEGEGCDSLPVSGAPRVGT